MKERIPPVSVDYRSRGEELSHSPGIGASEVHAVPGLACGGFRLVVGCSAVCATAEPAEAQHTHTHTHTHSHTHTRTTSVEPPRIGRDPSTTVVEGLSNARSLADPLRSRIWIEVGGLRIHTAGDLAAAVVIIGSLQRDRWGRGQMGLEADRE